MIDARKNLGLFGAALIGSMALGSSAFAVEPLPQGYQLASAKAPGKANVVKASAAPTTRPLKVKASAVKANAAQSPRPTPKADDLPHE